MGDMADWINEDFDWDDFNSPDHDTFCKYCHRGPFDWKLTDKGWRLFTQEREIIHSCKAYSKKRRGK
jgi:hypothetical protein